MGNSIFTNAVFLLSLFLTLSLAAPDQYAATLVSRQQTTIVDPCADYSRIANISTIGSNTTYRSIFYSRSLTGTMYDGRMFKDAMAALPKLTKDTALNSQCGNLTEIALAEAARNFTLKIVGPFSQVAPEGIRAGPEVCYIVGGIVVLFFGVWSFMP